ncbi:hypothetical protein OAG91_01295, partial [bacterium]|nr:hypothetical protein [bacterium]
MRPKILIYVKEYSDELAKRQPWYSIGKLKSDLAAMGNEVQIITKSCSLPEISESHLIKTFGLSDLFTCRPICARFTYLITFPIYGRDRVFKMRLKTLKSNWRDLYRIFLMALVPRVVLRRALSRADNIICISDRSQAYLRALNIKTHKYYPFVFGNWGGANLQKVGKHGITLGYFGPPYRTRCFDQVVKFFEWIHSTELNYKSKVICRIERSALKKEEKRYRAVFKRAKIELVSGFLSRESLTKELLDIDVFILPFEVVMSELPIVVLEALELRRKIVSTEDSGIAELTADSTNVLILDK